MHEEIRYYGFFNSTFNIPRLHDAVGQEHLFKINIRLGNYYKKSSGDLFCQDIP